MNKKNPFKLKLTAREKELMVVRRPLICNACREVSALFAKGVGYHPYEWEMNCSFCHRYAIGLDAYEPKHTEVFKKLQELRKQHVAGSSTVELAGEVESLAAQYDDLLSYAECECGGRLSIAAKPKCIYCDVEIFDSYFHFVDQLVD